MPNTDRLTKKFRIRASREKVFIAQDTQEDDIIPLAGYIKHTLKTKKKVFICLIK